MTKKTAIILLNLGGPDSKTSIKPFLFNFFMDKNIIQAPLPVRFFLAKLISIRRSKREAGESYHELGDKSPLLANSTAQAELLEQKLNSENKGEFKTFICMRYWHPMSDEVVKDVQNYAPDEIMLLPLYPQFSTTTTKSSFETWDKTVKKVGFNAPTTRICCYPWDEGYIKGCAQNIADTYAQSQKQSDKPLRILLSAHGLPEKIIKQGDPYQWQCEQSAAHIMKEFEAITGIENPDWQICYQSRVGPLKWIGPSTEEALQKAADDNVGVVILPHAFTQEHVETLVEIEIEYREEAEKMGLHEFYRVPTVGTADVFIEGLKNLVLNNLGAHKTLSHTGQPLCPSNSKNCCMRQSIKEAV
jgi:ferrochelatase